MSERVLEVRDLKKYFPIRGGVIQRTVEHVRAVDGVSLSIKRGTTLGLVGESGCGKTTVGRAILRLTDPTSGSVRFQGTDVAAAKRGEIRALRPRMQIVFQDPMSSLNPRMAVGQILSEPLAENPEVLTTTREERATLDAHRRRLRAWRLAALAALGLAAAALLASVPFSWAFLLALALGLGVAARLGKLRVSALVVAWALAAAAIALAAWRLIPAFGQPAEPLALALAVVPAASAALVLLALAVLASLPPVARLSVSMGGRIRARVAQLLEQVGLRAEHAHRFPHEFSGGQRQRIGVARALALNPEFIVLDEPTSALDVSVQAQVLNLLKKLQRDLGLTYLFISHDLSVVRHLCDEVAVMYLGRIVEHGPVEEVFNDPQHPYTQALLSSVPIPDPTLRAQRIILTGDVPSPVNPPPACRFNPRCPRAQDVCRTVDPPLEEKKRLQLAACHFPGPQEKWPVTQPAVEKVREA